ncbi:TPA_asm: hypothetical protein [Altiarchaeum virus]|nr:TPA_asm: hypothetical protein [Altiarchaeum virus]
MEQTNIFKFIEGEDITQEQWNKTKEEFKNEFKTRMMDYDMIMMGITIRLKLGRIKN